MRNSVASFKPKAIIMWQPGTLDFSDDKQGARWHYGKKKKKSVAPVVHLKAFDQDKDWFVPAYSLISVLVEEP